MIAASFSRCSGQWCHPGTCFVAPWASHRQIQSQWGRLRNQIDVSPFYHMPIFRLKGSRSSRSMATTMWSCLLQAPAGAAAVIQHLVKTRQNGTLMYIICSESIQVQWDTNPQIQSNSIFSVRRRVLLLTAARCFGRFLFEAGFKTNPMTVFTTSLAKEQLVVGLNLVELMLFPHHWMGWTSSRYILMVKVQNGSQNIEVPSVQRAWQSSGLACADLRGNFS